MTLIALLLQATAIYCFTWALWRIFRHHVVSSPLDNIPGPRSPSFWKGNLGQMFERHGWQFQRELGEQYGSVVKTHGLFGRRELFVFDPAALHSMCVKNSHVYEETNFSILTNRLMFGGGLLAVLGDEHKKQRKMLTPVFNSKHMKSVLPIFYRISYKLRDAVATRVESGTSEIDILHWISRAALELVGQGGLGYSFDSLTDDIPNEYTDALKTLSSSMVPMYPYASIIAAVLPYMTKIGSAAFRRRVVESIPVGTLQRARIVSDAMASNSKELIAGKKTAIAQGDEVVLQQVGEGKDIMSKLLQSNLAAEAQDKLSDEELLGQMALLVFAATDTSSGAIARILQLLGDHPDVQQKLREEILAAKGDKEALEYQELVDLPYLDAVLRETLRLYPPVIQISRTARKDMMMPLSTPITGNDGSLIHEIFVPEGTDLYIGILACNRNPAIWGEDVYEWKPERWLSPLPDAVTNAHVPGIYSHLFTFLGGGRSCIGFKFAQMEMKVLLSVLLENFTFAPSGKPIVWNLAGIQYPTVGRDAQKESMPMKIGIVHNS